MKHVWSTTHAAKRNILLCLFAQILVYNEGKQCWLVFCFPKNTAPNLESKQIEGKRTLNTHVLGCKKGDHTWSRHQENWNPCHIKQIWKLSTTSTRMPCFAGTLTCCLYQKAQLLPFWQSRTLQGHCLLHPSTLSAQVAWLSTRATGLDSMTPQMVFLGKTKGVPQLEPGQQKWGILVFFLFDDSPKMCWTWSCASMPRFCMFFVVSVVSDFSNVPSFTSTSRNCNFNWMMNQIMS